MHKLLMPLGLASLLFSGAIFGFFYAWICSTMWGLDATDPRVAIQAMQAMNASVRNPVFAPAFFGTPFVLLLTGVIAITCGYNSAGMGFAAGGVLYLAGGMMLTMLVNVPMNEALALVEIPAARADAAQIWAAYSSDWQFWNTTRTAISALALLLAGWGMWMLGRAPGATTKKGT